MLHLSTPLPLLLLLSLFFLAAPTAAAPRPFGPGVLFIASIEASASPDIFVSPDPSLDPLLHTPEPSLSPELSLSPLPELDMADADGRPFPPAACECIVAGSHCSSELAGASAVCTSGVSGTLQNKDCAFTCCRLCMVNEAAPYCRATNVQIVCALWDTQTYRVDWSMA